jgi:PPOX class probable F420-dependent enzyme
MATTSAIDTIGSAKYISLTTFRKDGTAVATPVWLVRDGDALRVVTDPMSGKAKRLRNNPSVLVSPCDMRGRVKDGAASVPATVSFQGDDDTAQTLKLISARYGLMGRIITYMNERKAKKASGGTTSHVGLTITFTAVGDEGTPA